MPSVCKCGGHVKVMRQKSIPGYECCSCGRRSLAPWLVGAALEYDKPIDSGLPRWYDGCAVTGSPEVN